MTTSMRWIALALMFMGCGGDAERMTLGELCDEAANAYCSRASTCGLATYNDCFQAFKPSCCQGAGCAAPPVDVHDTGAWMRACIPALQEESCSDVQRGSVPPACLMSR